MEGESWRQVPKVNVLGRQRSRRQPNSLLRIFLVLVLLFAAFITYSQNGLRTKAEASIDDGVFEIQLAQRQLDAAQAGIEPLQTQINTLKSTRKLTGDSYRLVTAGLINWHEALSALLGIQAEGVYFTSVTTQAEGIVSLSGVAPAPGAMVNLAAQFSVVSDTLDFQGIQWDTGRNPPIFIATFKVR